MARVSKRQMLGMFMSGLAVGAAVALLYAPKNGTQTRKDIRKFTKKTVDRLEDLQEDFRSQVSDRYEQALDAFENVMEFVEDSREKIQKIIKTA